MFGIDKWNEIWISLTKHKLRTVLTAFGVFWGIFMLILLLGAGKGLENGVSSNFAGYSTKSFYMGANKTDIVYKGMKIGRTIEPNISDILALKIKFPEIEAVSPKQSIRNDVTISYGTKNASYSVQGIYPDWRKVEEVNILEGRDLNDFDEKDHRKVIVIGQKVRDFYFSKDESPIGKYLNINGLYFKVIGVSKPQKSGWQANEELKSVWMSYSALQTTFNQKNKVYFWGCVVREGYNTEDVIKKVRAFIAKRHNFDPEDGQAVWAWSMETESAKFRGLFGAIAAFVWVVGIGTIIAGIVGVSNIMLIIVKERTKEIGIRKALGATSWSVVSMIIQEAIVLTLSSGYMGLILGVGLLEGINYMMSKAPTEGGEGSFFKNPEVDFTVAVSAVVLLAITGTLAGLIPAIRAAKIQPIEALRDE